MTIQSKFRRAAPSVITFLLVGLVASGIMVWKSSKANPTFEYWNVEVLQKHDDYHYTMRNESGVFEAIFCNDYKPVSLESGTFLIWFKYEDRGECWSVKDPGLGYHLWRDGITGVQINWPHDFEPLLDKLRKG